jgi:hypothetical protein
MHPDEKRRIERNVLRKQWDAIIPEFLPGDYQFDIWLNRYSYIACEYGVEYTAVVAKKKRDAGTPMDADYLLRYASACMRNRDLDIKENDARRARKVQNGVR